jgi:hypothetical protein
VSSAVFIYFSMNGRTLDGFTFGGNRNTVATVLGECTVPHKRTWRTGTITNLIPDRAGGQHCARCHA